MKTELQKKQQKKQQIIIVVLTWRNHRACSEEVSSMWFWSYIMSFKYVLVVKVRVQLQ